MFRETRQSGGMGESSRRAFVTRGGLLASGLALGLSGSGSAVQVDGEGEADQQAMMYPADFRPGATFRVVSPPIDWRPVGEDPLFEPDLFEDFDTRAILYADERGDDDDDDDDNDDSGENEGDDNDDDEGESPRFFFPTGDAEVQMGQFYELGEEARPVGEADDLLGDVLSENPDAGEGLVVVTFSGVASTPTPEGSDGTPTPESTPTEDG